MVGVKNADDAKAVVDNYHVGGIFIGSWTDLSIFDGPLADIAANPGPLPLAVSVDEEGGRVSRLQKRIGPAPSPKQLAQTQTPQQVHDLALQRGQADEKAGHHRRLRPGGRRHRCPGRHRDRGPLVRL